MSVVSPVLCCVGGLALSLSREQRKSGTRRRHTTHLHGRALRDAPQEAAQQHSHRRDGHEAEDGVDQGRPPLRLAGVVAGRVLGVGNAEAVTAQRNEKRRERSQTRVAHARRGLVVQRRFPVSAERVCVCVAAQRAVCVYRPLGQGMQSCARRLLVSI